MDIKINKIYFISSWMYVLIHVAELPGLPSKDSSLRNNIVGT